MSSKISIAGKAILESSVVSNEPEVVVELNKTYIVKQSDYELILEMFHSWEKERSIK